MYFESISTIRLDMLELMGRGYVIEHCIAALREKTIEKSYRAYVTDALMMIVENGTHFLIPGYGAADYGKTMSKRWLDVLDTNPPPPEDNRSCAEQAADMWTRIRGEKK